MKKPVSRFSCPVSLRFTLYLEQKKKYRILETSLDVRSIRLEYQVFYFSFFLFFSFFLLFSFFFLFLWRAVTELAQQLRTGIDYKKQVNYKINRSSSTSSSTNLTTRSTETSFSLPSLLCSLTLFFSLPFLNFIFVSSSLSLPLHVDSELRSSAAKLT